MDELSQCLAHITPESLRKVIIQLAAQQAPDNRFSVGVSVIVGQLIAGYDLGGGLARRQAYDRFAAAVRLGVEQIEGMRYVPSMG